MALVRTYGLVAAVARFTEDLRGFVNAKGVPRRYRAMDHRGISDGRGRAASGSTARCTPDASTSAAGPLMPQPLDTSARRLSRCR
jgi:hypothetical protein